MELEIPTSEPEAPGRWVPTEDGYRLEPPLEVVDPDDVTLEMLTEACALLGIDADDIIAGRDVEIPAHPPLANAEAFLKIALENSEAYDIGRMQWSRANALLASVVAHFIEPSAPR